MIKNVYAQLKTVKAASQGLMVLDYKIRALVLQSLAQQLRTHTHRIIEQNQLDLEAMQTDDPRYDRLLLSKERIEAMALDVENIASLYNPVGQVIEEKLMPNGLRIEKITVPLGVVAVIYESRPNVTIDVFSLCFKTGNACILKGGKEAHHSNIVLVSLIQQALREHHLDVNAIYLLPSEREATQILLDAVGVVDVCIPRGGQALINYVRDHAKIPVIETGAGIVHTYFDLSGDVDKGRLIVNNAKTRRVSVCNALDTLVIHEARLSSLCLLVEPLALSQVELYADEPSYAVLTSFYPSHLLYRASAEDFGHEFLAYKMAIKTVASVEDAVEHIRRYTSGHSEAIIADDEHTIHYFLDHIDTAATYVNASTAFTDGGQFGLGAEIGISTQKLHARGPMALDALTSYKWVIWGDGHIRI